MKIEFNPENKLRFMILKNVRKKELSSIFKIIQSIKIDKIANNII